MPAWATVCFPAPVDGAARRHVLIAAIGQSAGRLRLHRLRIIGDPLAARTKLAV